MRCEQHISNVTTDYECTYQFELFDNLAQDWWNSASFNDKTVSMYSGQQLSTSSKTTQYIYSSYWVFTWVYKPTLNYECTYRRIRLLGAHAHITHITY